VTRPVRLAVFAVAAAALAVLLGLAITDLPTFGTSHHPYGDRAVRAALHDRRTANTVASVNFDQRAVDTLGEEFILFTALVGTLVVLRELRGEESRSGAPEEPERAQRPLPSTTLVAYLFLPLTTLVGLYVVAHGHVSPGGGFQGGALLASAIHLLYVGGGFGAIRRARPTGVYEVLDALGAGGFVVLGLAGTALTGGLLVNVLPLGALGDLLSGGTVELFNALVGLEVASAMIVLLARFLEQYVELRAGRDAA
jgi:multicomponent Na+:H+ antiporter subunit B